MIYNLMLSCGIVIMDQSVTVAVDRGSTLDYNDMEHRHSPLAGPRWTRDDMI